MSYFSTENCTLFPEEPHKCLVIFTIKTVTSVLSLIGSIFMMSMIIFFMKYETLSGKLILNLAVATLLDSIIFVANHTPENDPICALLGSILTYCDWALLLAICAITFCIWRETEKTKHLIPLFCICWISPIVPTFLPFIKDGYGHSGPWCWVIDAGFRFGVWFVPFLLIMLILLVLFIVIFVRYMREIRNTQATTLEREKNKKYFLKEIRPLLGYPIFFWVLKMFAIINRFYSVVHRDNEKEKDSYPLYVLMVLCSPIVGLVFSLIFIYSISSDFKKIKFKSQCFKWKNPPERPFSVDVNEI